jgi:hypothetical protein
MDAAPIRYPSPVAIDLSATSLLDSSSDMSDISVGATCNDVNAGSRCNFIVSVEYALIELEGIDFIAATLLFVGDTNPWQTGKCDDSIKTNRQHAVETFMCSSSSGRSRLHFPLNPIDNF